MGEHPWVVRQALEAASVPPIDVALVGRLVAVQFPQWAGRPVVAAIPQGWDNRTFRLGADLAVRLPSAERYRAQVDKEHRWLPVLAAQLALPIPMLQARGVPGENYPFPWSVYRWLEGETAATARLEDPGSVARSLAGFLVALQRCDPVGGPPPGPHCFWRGGPLSTYDVETRRTIRELGDLVDGSAATAVWDAALAARGDGRPVWFHGDVAPGNLLIRGDDLTAVIDFGCCGVGDPACDLTIAWTLFSGESREAFRAGLAVDAATWARGRGWALWKALITLVEHRVTDPAAAGAALDVVHDVQAEHAATVRP
ncbi:MAG: aminoglycoside phosphotransferase family protein [Actinomycetota bacterium]|nr:aminoglycoside phosphotransferase family protein [Actinomycetota bacterium]